MHLLWLDVRDAVRRLWARPGFTLLATAILAIGIGATTGLLSLGHAVLARPLPYPEPERLVKLLPYRPGAAGASATFSEGEYIELERRSSALTAITAYYPSRSVSVSDGGLPVQVPATRATASLFATLGAVPALGRSFLPEEDAPGSPLVVLMSWTFWLDRYGGEPNVVGRSIVRRAPSARGSSWAGWSMGVRRGRRSSAWSVTCIRRARRYQPSRPRTSCRARPMRGGR